MRRGWIAFIATCAVLALGTLVFWQLHFRQEYYWVIAICLVSLTLNLAGFLIWLFTERVLVEAREITSNEHYNYHVNKMHNHPPIFRTYYRRVRRKVGWQK